MGIRGIALQLLKSYLKDRQQVVRVGKVTNNARTVQIGILQGSILGLLFFIHLINDLLYDHCICYADDMVVYYRAKGWVGAKMKIELLLTYFSVWIASKRPSLNLNKSSFITFGAYID